MNKWRWGFLRCGSESCRALLVSTGAWSLVLRLCCHELFKHRLWNHLRSSCVLLDQALSMWSYLIQEFVYFIFCGLPGYRNFYIQSLAAWNLSEKLLVVVLVGVNSPMWNDKWFTVIAGNILKASKCPVGAYKWSSTHLGALLNKIKGNLHVSEIEMHLNQHSKEMCFGFQTFRQSYKVCCDVDDY